MEILLWLTTLFHIGIVSNELNVTEYIGET